MIEQSEEKIKSRHVGDIDSSSFGIEEENLGMAYKAFMQYSNPIGSIVREITSNAWDATIEAGKKDPVVVKASEKYPIDDERFIVFEDSGTGLVPLPQHTPDGRKVRNMLEEGKISKGRFSNIIETIKEKILDAGVPSMLVYKMFFSSTKRKKIDQLGYFGLGAKSPLGYTDMFEVITSRSGFRYHYIVRKGEEKPQLDLLDWEETDNHNGTIIRVPIESRRDWTKFKEAAKSQLCYFDNVVFEGGLEDKIDNDFTIYRGKHFIYRPDSPFDTMHLCLGKVYYPLDFDIMDIKEGYYNSYGSSERTGHYIPVGLRFPLEDQEDFPLKVVWNRESIEYNKKTRDSIYKKLRLARFELRELYRKQYEDLDSVKEWMEKYFLPEGRSITINSEVEIPVTEDIVGTKEIDIPGYSNLDKTPGDPIYMFKFHRAVDDGYINQDRTSIKRYNLLRKPQNYDPVYVTKESFTTKKNKWISSKIQPDGKSRFIIMQIVHLEDDLSDPDDKERIINRYNSYFSNTSSEPTDQELKEMLKYEKEMAQYLKNKFRDYDDVTVSDSFSPRKGKKRNKNKYANYDPDKKFPLKTASPKDGYNDSYGWSRTRWKYERMKDIDKTGVLVIYGHREDDNQLIKLMEILNRIGSKYRARHGNKFHRDRLQIVKIAKDRREMFDNLSNSYHITNFMDSDHKIIKKIVNAFTIRGELPSSRKMRSFKNHVPEAYSLYNELSSLKSNFSFGLDSIGDNWIEDFLEDRKHLIDKEYEKKLKTLRGYMLKYPILLKLDSGTINPTGLAERLDLDEEVDQYVEDRPSVDPYLLYRYKTQKNQQQNGKPN